MKNKVVLILVIFVLFSGIAFADEPAGGAANSVALSVGFLGAEASYEYMFSNNFSVLGSVSYTTLFVLDEFTISAKGRWYPFGKTFFLDLGLGYSYGKGMVGGLVDLVLGVFTFGWWFTQDDINVDTGGFLVQPGLGWKIDIGEPAGFVLPISMGLDIKLGSIPDAMAYGRIGLGYSF